MISLAIVIPFYKIDFFEETIQSLAFQTNQNFLLYIGNDKSVSDPLDILKKYFSEDRYCYFNYDKNIGKDNLVAAWWRIIDEVPASVDWIQILGDDDKVDSVFVDEILKKTKDLGNINVIKVKSVIIDDNNKIVHDFSNRLLLGYYSSLNLFFKKSFGQLNSSLSEHIFRLSKLRTVGIKSYPLAWHSDDYLILKISDFGQIFFMDSTTVYVREFHGSISGKTENIFEKELATKLFYKDIIREIDVDKMDSETRKLYQNFIICFRRHLPLGLFLNRVTRGFTIGGFITIFAESFKRRFS